MPSENLSDGIFCGLNVVVQFSDGFTDGGNAFFQRLSVLRDAHADALACVRVILRVDADEEMLARNNQRTFGFEHFVQGLRRNGQVFKPEPQENRAFGLVDFQRIRAQLALEQRDGGLRLIAVKRPDDVV